MKINWDAHWRLMRFDRPIGILLLLWPTWWSLLLAGNGRPSVKNFLIFTAGVAVMRAAGCVMNDIADRNYDPHVERTRDRPLARGELDLRQACVTFVLLMIAALLLVLMTDRLTILLACVGALLAASYPFFKRFTDLPQVVLGIAFGWGIPMAFSAETGMVPSLAWTVLAVNIVWATIYDTFYAMVDREDDRAIGVRSTALLFGRHDLFAVNVLMIIMILLLAFIGWQKQLHWPWFLGIAVVIGLFAWQQWVARQRDRASCFRAFKNNNWVGVVIFLGLAGHYIEAGNARAATHTAIAAAPAALTARVHSVSVVPVVRTSSTRATLALAS